MTANLSLVVHTAERNALKFPAQSARAMLRPKRSLAHARRAYKAKNWALHIRLQTAAR